MLQGEPQSNSETSTEDSSSGFNKLVEDFYNNVVWRQLHALLGISPIKSSPHVIAEIFSISVDEAVDAIEGLSDLGLLTKNGDTYTIGKQKFLIPDNMNTRESRTAEHINQSRQILDLCDAKLDFCGWTHYLAASRQNIHWFRQEFKKLIDELEERENANSSSTEKELYSITYSDVPTRINNRGDQG